MFGSVVLADDDRMKFIPSCSLILTVVSLAVSSAAGATIKGASSGLSAEQAVAAATQISGIISSTTIYAVENAGQAEPLYEDNALLLVEPARYADLRRGDVVMVADAATGAVVAHRLVNEGRAGWETELRGRPVAVTEGNLRGRVFGVLYTSRDDNRTAANETASFGGRG